MRSKFSVAAIENIPLNMQLYVLKPFKLTESNWLSRNSLQRNLTIPTIEFSVCSLIFSNDGKFKTK